MQIRVTSKIAKKANLSLRPQQFQMSYLQVTWMSRLVSRQTTKTVSDIMVKSFISVYLINSRRISEMWTLWYVRIMQWLSSSKRKNLFQIDRRNKVPRMALKGLWAPHSKLRTKQCLIRLTMTNKLYLWITCLNKMSSRHFCQSTKTWEYAGKSTLI